ncbi:unnamed protein product [Oikopleura dioica]|uniref:Sulfotransferase n=1 Tax=Oikopleura dioica TaxID=34765 RepID=E4X6Z3_OIKDI|nr:unnamed protein product [Oikopleura dioica]
MVVLRRRQLNLIRGCVFLFGLLGMLAFLYYFTEDTKEIQRKLENVLRDINEDTDNAMEAIKELEDHLEDLEIRPMPEAQFVVYNRVPKCASMSMTTLSYKLGGKNNFKVESPYEPGEKPEKTITEQREFVDFLQNQEPPYMYIRHQYYIDFSELNEDFSAAYINMIRDPIDRFESFYYFSRFGNEKGGGGNARLSDEQRNESVDECVAKRRRECTQPVWQVVPYFCGMDAECNNRHIRAVQIAKEHIEENYLFVGTLEEMNLSLGILEKLLPSFFGGARELTGTDESQNMKTQTKTLNKKKTSSETREWLKENTSLKLEYELYDFVVKRLHRAAKKLKVS